MRSSSSAVVATSAWPMPGSIQTSRLGRGGGERLGVAQREVAVGVAVHDQQRTGRDGAGDLGRRLGHRPATWPARAGSGAATGWPCGPTGVSTIQWTRRIDRVPRSNHRPGALTLTTASASPPRPAWRSTAVPPIDQPSTATKPYPFARSQATAAATSWISSAPAVPSPPERPCPRKSGARTPMPAAARCRLIRRTCGLRDDPVNPCATTQPIVVRPASAPRRGRRRRRSAARPAAARARTSPRHCRRCANPSASAPVAAARTGTDVR